MTLRLRNYLYVLLVSHVFAQFCHLAPIQYSEIIVDTSGAVIHSHEADAITYPASLTKMMTLYLLFEALASKRISMHTQLKTSVHATTQAPSRLGLKVGERLTVYEAMMALIVKSANDVAVTVAEGLAGTEAAFAEKMTAKAHQLGMRHTRFVNASGLPNKHQKTTARDMVTLGLAIYRRFPSFYKLFKTKNFYYKGVEYKTHNHLLGKVLGCDGLKTGFINASGYNLVSSAKRQGKRYFIAVLGGKTRHARDISSAGLIEYAFNRNYERNHPKTVYAQNDSFTKKTPSGTLDSFFEDLNRPAVSEGRVIHTSQTANSPIKINNTHFKYLSSPRTKSIHRKHLTPKGWSVQLGSTSKQQLIRLLKNHKQPALLTTARHHKKLSYKTFLKGYTQKQALSACRNFQRSGLRCKAFAIHKNNI